MKSNKLLTILLIVTFFLAGGMFYYQNFYKDAVNEENMAIVLVAKTQIAKGEELNETNIGAIKIPKEAVLPGFQTDVKKVSGKVATTNLFQNEVLVKERFGDETAKEKTFIVTVKPKNDLRGLEEKDSVRIAVIPTELESTDMFSVADEKVVKTVAQRLNSSGEATGVAEGVSVVLTEKEVAQYHKALKSGEIYLLKYDELTDIERNSMQTFQWFLDNLPEEDVQQ